MKHVYTPVEYVLNPYDDRLWYYIPGFNGYELSNDYYIRSMKHYRKYPFGILLEPVKKADGSYDKKDPSFSLSNDNNERVVIKLSEIVDRVNHMDRAISGYPRRTYVTDIQSRNKFVMKKRKHPLLDDITTSPAVFTIIQDDPYNN